MKTGLLRKSRTQHGFTGRADGKEERQHGGYGEKNSPEKSSPVGITRDKVKSRNNRKNPMGVGDSTTTENFSETTAVNCCTKMCIFYGVCT